MANKLEVSLTSEDLKFLEKLAGIEKLVGFTKGVLTFSPIAGILTTSHAVGKVFTFISTDWIEHFAEGPNNLERIKVCGISKKIQEYVVLNDIEGARYDFFEALDRKYSNACSS